MRIEEIPTGVILCGPVVDEPRLLGIMAWVRALGFCVVSAHPVASGSARTR